MPLARLQDLLKQKVFKEAIRRKGIEDHELVPRPPASFRVQANRASLLSPVEAQLHFEAFEKRRMQLLAMVLAEWEVCEGERKKEDARLKKEEDKLTSIFHNRLSSERNRLQNIVTARTKVEGVQLVENKILK